MKILGIDPAPGKESLVFDGKEFIDYCPQKNKNCAKELKKYINELQEVKNSIFIAWDAPLSAAIDEKNFL